MTTKNLTVIALAAVTIVTAAPASAQTLIDSRDGKKYRMVVIGNQTWMAENLNYETGNSWCYNNNAINCNRYGRLYDWATAEKACPSGWRLPTPMDWGMLIGFAAGESQNAGTTLRANKGWKVGSAKITGTDDFAFTAMPGGIRAADGSFKDGGAAGFWWSFGGDGFIDSIASAIVINENLKNTAIMDFAKSNGLSVRCLFGASEPQEVFTIRYVNSPGDGYLNLRAGPSANTAIVMEITHGSLVEVSNKGTLGNWVKVKAKGLEGYVSKNFLSETQFVPTAPKPRVTKGTFTDPRDNTKYRTVTINGLTWMAENLNYWADKSHCYDNNAANCTIYGRLYDWNTANKACPSGWSLPSKSDWNFLLTAAGGDDKAGNILKSKSGWNDNANGTDEFGFSALSSGIRILNGEYNEVGNYGFWWTSTRGNTDEGKNGAYRAQMGSIHEDVYLDAVDYGYGFSIRCVKDGPRG